MTLQQIWTVFVFSGAVTLLLASGILWLRENGIRPIHNLLQRYGKLTRLAQIFIALFVVQLFVYGSTKATGGDDDDDDTPDDPPASTNVPPADWPGEGTREPPVGRPMMCAPQRLALSTSTSITGFTDAQIAAEAAFASAGTNEAWDFSPPQGATLVERWRKHGAARQRLPLGCEHPKDGPMMIDTFGRLTTEHRTFAPLGVQVGMVPEANWAKIGRTSLAWWMVTPSNTTVVCWQNALLNRDTNTPVSVQAEFFDSGRFEYRYDLSAAGAEATNIVARVLTTNGEETVRLDAGVTSVRGWLLGPEDGQTLDKDNDGISTYDEIFIYGTDPELPDSDGDGRSDGEEIRNGDNPLVSEVSDAVILARIAGGATNETVELVEGVLESTKLWDGFAFQTDAGTNALFTRTFDVDRKNGWTSYFLSGRGEPWCADGEDAIQDWKLYGTAVEWSDDTGASGTLTASPRGDTLYLPVATNAASVTISLRSIGGLGNGDSGLGTRHASPGPVFLLKHSPKLLFPGGQEIEGDDGNHYSVFTDIEDFALTVDNSNRPCRAATFEGEASAATFPVPTEAGVYSLPAGTRADQGERPRLMMGPRLGAPNDDNGHRYLVILNPWVTYGTGHYGCCHDYPYNWGWSGCDCTPECGCGVSGHAAVNAYIDHEDSSSCVGVVEVAGRQVWSGEAYHEVWECTHDPDDEPEGSCPCGCNAECEHCSCVPADAPALRSIRFRASLGENDGGETVEVINGTNFVFGSDGRLQRLTAGTNDEEVVMRTISYDDNGRVVLVDDGTNGFLTVSYDDAGAVTNVFVSTEDGGGATQGPPTAPRPRLLGSNGGGMTLLDALLHFRNGDGSPVTLPFSEVNTDGLRPIDFDCVKDFVANCHTPDSYHVVGTKAVPARGQIRLVLGDVTVTLDGTITYTGHCNWSFEGTMSGEDDTYDFNAANRGALGESLTDIGRTLLDGSGTPYTIQFAGSEPLTGSGHCGDR